MQLRMESRLLRRGYSLRVLLVSTVLIGASIGLSAKLAIDFMNRLTSGELWDRWAEELQVEFATTNPDCLDDWDMKYVSEYRNIKSWADNGILFVDTNGDGKPDLKRREWPVTGTTEVLWLDTDFDGFFDTERESGCSGEVDRAITPPIAVPAPNSAKRKTIRQGLHNE